MNRHLIPEVLSPKSLLRDPEIPPRSAKSSREEPVLLSLGVQKGDRATASARDCYREYVRSDTCGDRDIHVR